VVKQYPFKHTLLQISSKTLRMATFRSGLTLCSSEEFCSNSLHCWIFKRHWLLSSASPGVCFRKIKHQTFTPKHPPSPKFHPILSLRKSVFKRATLPKRTLQPLCGLRRASSSSPVHCCYSGKQFICQGLGHLGVWKGHKHFKKGFTACPASQLLLSLMAMVLSILSSALSAGTS